MTKLERRSFGFWHTLLTQNKWRLTGWEGVFAVLIGVGGGIELARITTRADRLAIAGDFLTLISVVLGLILAAFALIAAFLSDNYTLQLQKNPKGVKAFFAPFMINVGIDVGLVLAIVAYRACATFIPYLLDKICFTGLATVFVYSLLNVVALARTVMAHAVTRAELVELEHLEATTKTRPGQMN